MENWGGLNNALFAWRNGVNALLPKRSTRSDGGRANSDHASTSQHQPDSDGTVDAFDEDRNYLGSGDPAGSPMEDRIHAALNKDFMADPRAHLIISDRTIRNDQIGNWKVRPYHGDSPHTEHTHRQVHQSLEDDGRPWKFTHTKGVLGFKPRKYVMVKLDGYEVPILKRGDDDNTRPGWDNVRKAQKLLGIKVDGIYGKQMTASVKALFGGNGETIGLHEWIRLFGLEKSE